MSVQSEITRISGNVTDALAAIAEKGVTVPTGSTSDALASLIASIETGGGGGGGSIEPFTSVVVGEFTADGIKTLAIDGLSNCKLFVMTQMGITSVQVKTCTHTLAAMYSKINDEGTENSTLSVSAYYHTMFSDTECETGAFTLSGDTLTFDYQLMFDYVYVMLT